jgi:hypothetical protein
MKSSLTMTAQPVPPATWAQPISDGRGVAHTWFRNLVDALWQRTGGQVDKVDAAASMAASAVPQGAEVNALGGLQNGGQLGGNLGLTLYSTSVAVADLPSGTELSQGDWAYAVDGCKPGEGSGAGTGVPVFWSAGNWVSACSGATVTA